MTSSADHHKIHAALRKQLCTNKDRSSEIKQMMKDNYISWRDGAFASHGTDDDILNYDVWTIIMEATGEDHGSWEFQEELFRDLMSTIKQALARRG